jgi:abortive infection bacteriophage resistance protein
MANLNQVNQITIPLKPATTIQEQIRILRERGLTIEDDSYAQDILGKVNYYRLTAYMLPFKDTVNNNYRPGTNFNRICRIYEFDQKLRNIMLYTIEPIEILLRTKIAYYHAFKYGAEGYTNPDNFECRKRHEKLMEEFNKAIDNNNKTLFVKHHIEKYGRHFPVWVAVELFSMGMLSKFYSNMKDKDKKRISCQFKNVGPKHLSSWLNCITTLRNRCAHYARLYFHKFVSVPRLPRGIYTSTSGRIFDVIYIMKFLYLDHHKWKSSVVEGLDTLIQEYNDAIEIRYIGFPDNWREILNN